MRNQIDRVLSAVPFTLRVRFFGRVRPGFPPFQPKLLEADEKNGQKFLEAQLIPPLEAPTLPCFELPTRNCFQCFLLPASRRFWKHSEASSEAIPPRPALSRPQHWVPYCEKAYAKLGFQRFHIKSKESQNLC